MCEEENFDDNEHHAQNEKRDHFPAGEAGEIVAEKEQREATCRNHSRQSCAGNFEFEICADDSAK